ncbi:Hsp70 ATPase ssa1 [Thecaphora frezii]
MPLYIAFNPEQLVGDATKDQASQNPENTIFDAKQLIQHKWGKSDLKKDICHFPFKVVEKNGKPPIQVTINGEKKGAAE